LSALANVTATNITTGGLNAAGLSALNTITAVSQTIGALFLQQGCICYFIGFWSFIFDKYYSN
jgi:hypothetical protein